MKRAFLLMLVLAACVVAFGCAASTAMADDGGTGGDSQLLDVTKQVGDIQRKMNELIAHGQSARAGTLLASADCGYGDAAPVFAAWGDFASYALAPAGDL